MRNQREPSPRYDFRALAADRPVQRQLPTEPVTTPLIIESGKDTHGRAYALVSGIGEQAHCYALDLRRWADQLNKAADTLEGKA